MSTIVPDTERHYLNGAGKAAKVGDVTVHYGLEVKVYERSYWVVDARPNGIGFKLHVVDTDGRQFAFKTREVTVAEAPSAATPPAPAAVVDAAEHQTTTHDSALRHRSLITNLRAICPALHLSDTASPETAEHVHRCLEVATRLPTVARLPWADNPRATAAAALMVIEASVSPPQRERLSREMVEALFQHAGTAVVATLQAAVLDLHPPGVAAATVAALPDPPAGPTPAPAPAAPKPAPRAKSRHKKDIGDAVAAHLRATNSLDELVALLEPQLPQVRGWATKYGHLSFGLAKMNITNLVRKLHKDGHYTI
jgi:hypothetical protein